MMLLLSFTVFFHRCIDDRHFFKKLQHVFGKNQAYVIYIHTTELHCP